MSQNHLDKLNKVIEDLVKKVDFKYEVNLDRETSFEELLLLSTSLLRSRHPDKNIDVEAIKHIEEHYSKLKTTVAAFALVLSGDADIDVNEDGDLLFSVSKPGLQTLIDAESEDFLNNIKDIIDDDDTETGD